MITQGSPEWFAARLGKVTASKVADVIARTKSGPAASRVNYAAQLICERLTGNPAESFSSAAMQWGTDQEPFAREAYEFRAGVFVDQVGFIVHPLEITAMELPGLGVRVLMGAGGKMLAMGIVEARRVAAAFDTPAAHAAGLNVCTDLRDAADAAEAHGATRQ